MRIERISVGGGFLDGLSLDFADGLNVLIGSRGAGKTSILELIRFALSVNAMTETAQKSANQQARAVLGDGSVTVECTVQERSLTFSRTGLDDSPSVSARYSYAQPLIVSQNEIEAIGLSPSGRREILDRLVDPLDWDDAASQSIRSRVGTLEQKLERVRDEREQFEDRAAQLEPLIAELADAEAQQAKTSEAAKKLKPLQDALAARSDALGQVRAAADSYRLAEDSLKHWAEAVSSARLESPLPALPSASLDAQVSACVTEAITALEAAAGHIAEGGAMVSKARKASSAEQKKQQAALREDAENLEKVEKGAGDAGRRVSSLRQQLKERDGFLARIKELDKEIATLTKQRTDALDEGEAEADRRYQIRRALAAEISKTFHRRLEVRVDKSGEYSAYESALHNLLEGSNLRYKSLAALLAEKMSPREIVAAVEADDPDSIADAAGISKDRAAKVVSYLRGRQAGGLLLAPLDDAVDFALLDGQEYKPTRHLSTGQRCTVVLPLLLAQDRDSILLDQPEDNLDNAFIVGTVVEAIKKRSAEGQAIVATHNANIPVLGEAEKVVVLASDGRNGYVATEAGLEDSEAVEAITTLMEGGREAFERRARFYQDHDTDG